MSRRSQNIAIALLFVAAAAWTVWQRYHSAEHYHNRAMGHVLAGRYAESIDDYTAALDRGIGPAHLAHLNRGESRQRLGDFDGALADFDKAIELDPGLVNAHFGRGIALLNLRKPAEAIPSFDRSIALDPAFEKARAYRGLAIIKVGRIEEGAAEIVEAVRRQPELRAEMEKAGFQFSTRTNAI